MADLKSFREDLRKYGVGQSEGYQRDRLSCEGRQDIPAKTPAESGDSVKIQGDGTVRFRSGDVSLDSRGKAHFHQAPVSIASDGTVDIHLPGGVSVSNNGRVTFDF